MIDIKVDNRDGVTTLVSVPPVPTKQLCELRGWQLVDMVRNGDIEAVEMLVELRSLKLVVDKALSLVLDDAIDEAQTRYGGEFRGVGIRRNSGTVIWEYADTFLQESEAKLKQLKEDIKSRKAMLRNLKAPVADTETGEMIQPAKNVGMNPGSSSVTIPKE